MIFHDVAMNKVVENTEWLAFYDQLNFKVSANFEYEVGGYMAYALANYHRFFAGSVRQKIEYPRKDYEVIKNWTWNRSMDCYNYGMACWEILRLKCFATHNLFSFSPPRVLTLDIMHKCSPL